MRQGRDSIHLSRDQVQQLVTCRCLPLAPRAIGEPNARRGSRIAWTRSRNSASTALRRAHDTGRRAIIRASARRPAPQLEPTDRPSNINLDATLLG